MQTSGDFVRLIDRYFGRESLRESDLALQWDLLSLESIEMLELVYAIESCGIELDISEISTLDDVFFIITQNEVKEELSRVLTRDETDLA
jgi:hypothetical protein